MSDYIVHQKVVLPFGRLILDVHFPKDSEHGRAVRVRLRDRYDFDERTWWEYLHLPVSLSPTKKIKSGIRSSKRRK